MNICPNCTHWPVARESCELGHPGCVVDGLKCGDFVQRAGAVSAGPKISAIMIVKDAEDSLRACLDSVIQHVDQVVCVDTGSTDKTQEICRRYGVTLDVFTGCNDPATGKIENFSEARNRSLELAEHEWILWIDSDDTLHGGEHLRQLVDERARMTLGLRGLTESPNATRYLMRYQYAPDISQWRERLVGPRNLFQWQGPVHEGLFAKPGVAWDDTMVDAIWVEHHAHELDLTKKEVGRNLRILQKYCAKNGDRDPRMLCYLGIEYASVGQFGPAVKNLRRAGELETWPDQKAVAQLQLSELYAHIEDHETAIYWAVQALVTKSWPAPCYRMAKTFHQLARLGENPEYNYRRCIRWARMGIESRQFNPPQLLIENTYEHGEIFNFLATALFSLGFLDEVIEACQEGLKLIPGDHDLTNNLTVAQRRKRDSECLGPCSITQPKREMPAGKLDVALFTGGGMERWDPDTIARTGIGGSETMAWELARRLAKRGHRVRLYGDPPAPGEHEGVEFLRHQDFFGVECDALIASRRADVVDPYHGCVAHSRILWVHDVCAPGLDMQRMSRLDEVWCLSNWHREFLGKFVPPGARDKLVAIRNGIDVEKIRRIEVGPKERTMPLCRAKHQAVYSSSPDRGLETALDCWAGVRDRVPDAELHVFYGFENYAAVAPAEAARLKAKTLATPGVVYHGRVSEHDLLFWMLTSGVWAYPTWDWAGPGAGETSCIGAMQAQACGLVPVTSPIAAMKETVFSGYLIDGNWRSPEYHKEWTDSVVAAMLTSGLVDGWMVGFGSEWNEDKMSVAQYARRRFSLEGLVDELEAKLVAMVAERRENVTPRFVEVEL